ADRNLQTPPAITTDHRRRLTRFAEKRPTAATSPLQAAKTSSPCIKAANRLRSIERLCFSSGRSQIPLRLQPLARSA
ncbi:hypothetical protein NKI95_34105, partial [Mesorhizobium sp. M0306]|uniref:hypothetical protein n=1 Tax=Mesorhizobium sp. M0306 TaxID=2956932 RepID=UPI0033393256